MAEKTQKTTSEMLEPFLVVIIFAVIMYVGYQLLIQPQLEQVLPGGALRVDTVSQQLSDRKSYYNSLSRLDTLYEQSNKNSTKNISELLPDDRNIPQIFASYEAIATAKGLNIKSIDVVNNKTTTQEALSGVQTLLISMKIANASYDSVKGFLDAVEKNIRIADVQSISFDPRSRMIDITIRSYYRTPSLSKQ